jgi:ribosomal protein S18 acetylase RimI-like enzyme
LEIDLKFTDLSIREMRLSDAAAVVAVHLKAFPGFFLSFLGPGFLRELYCSIVIDEAGISFVCCRGEKIIGFVAGTLQPAGFYSRLVRRRWWRFALASFKPALLKPVIIPRLFRALRKPGEVQSQSGVGLLMSIGVLPEAQGQGIAHELVKRFLFEARQRGLKQVNLTTDRLKNEKVNAFYERLGFDVIRTFTTPEGRQMNEYAIRLKDCKLLWGGSET